eukprot:TRINITY_DN5574_c0_g1_i1.p2 TRINITY_DN5574_c0_g1~~TRINITY_DN5574_c0_g1_i1.p2  ORF type:complete len:156 (-),score=27.11 TRINITY_DN5574_c0_g1_i1:200-667(-)
MARALNDALMCTPGLIELDLSCAGMVPLAIKELCPALRQMARLTVLDVSCNGLGRDGVHWLVQALNTEQHATSLQVLDMSHTTQNFRQRGPSEQLMNSCAANRARRSRSRDSFVDLVSHLKSLQRLVVRGCNLRQEDIDRYFHENALDNSLEVSC